VPNPISALKMEQINLHHSKAASAALLTRLATGKTGVVLIQEPWIVGNNICGSSTPYSIYSTTTYLEKSDGLPDFLYFL